jgi:tetratricopeptide (TPR) repeat protein
MKRILLMSAAAASGLAVLGGVQLTTGDEGVPFIDPLTIARSACGKDAAAILKRRAYFASIGAAEAALYDENSGAAQSRMNPVAGISYKVTTASEKAQALFDAGVAHMWNFNHGEAINAFQAAQKEDPNCAMCVWAEAFALGPNINLAMADEAVAPAYAAVQKALSMKASASDKEKALIDAVATRYVKAPVKDRSALDAAFADAMEKVAATFPDDDFIVATSAEANMDTQPWDYWDADGRTPKGRAGKTLSLLEAILARNPDYQPAIHLYIHTTEATTNPFRAVPYADRLAALSPGLGHLIHMPSHTYARIGRYKQSMELNLEAVKSDEAFLASADASPMYEYGYYVHNVHFVMTSAQMAGDKATALAMAKKLDAKIPVEMAIDVPLATPIKAAPYYVYAQFAEPADVLALENPGDDAPFLKAAWHYARGEAFARSGDAAAARAEAEAISALRVNSDFTKLVEALIPAPDILKIQQLTVTARASAAAGDMASATEAMEEVVALQDALPYTEPPYWYYPAKQTLAAMVLKTGDAERAEQLFVESLAEIPNNAWAFYGLAEAYRAQDDKSARKFAEGLMKASWLGEEKPALDRL